MSESGVQATFELESEALYVFPTPTRVPPLNFSGQTGLTTSTLSWLKEEIEESNKGLDENSIHQCRYPTGIRTHTRSASHGGATLATSSTGWQANIGASPTNLPTTSAGTSRPSALKKPGHQRAFSQGQVVDVHGSLPVTGHTRVGSKTDFILPPGHREDLETGGGGYTNIPSCRGHSRQASRSESIYTIRRSAAPPLWRRAWARCCGSLPEEKRLRTVVPNHLVPPKTKTKNHPNNLFLGNRVRTTKYTALSFLPRNLLEQFYRVANLYFIFIVLLNWLPQISAFGKEIAMIPVIFVLGVTALKDFFEDRRRYRSDCRVNSSMCRVYLREIDRYTKVAWKDVKVGDLVHLSNNEVIPADILLLRSSDPQGLAYLDTCNLDGETNLKQRQIVRGFQKHQDSFDPAKFRSVIEVDKPSTRIYRFYGAVVHPTGTRIPVTTENLLLRECLLKNTDFVEGIVVFAGHETKAMLNNGGPRYKRSRLERQMNFDIVWCVVILIVLCGIGAAGCNFWLSTFTENTFVPFLTHIFEHPYHEGWLTFWTFIIILQVMIPLSLYVTMEMAKIGQVYHIGNDIGLYDAETDCSAECRALNITEELGQIQHVFSDKTGTLTENKMIFRRCTVGGQDYEHEGETENILFNTRLKEDLLIGNMRHRLQEFLVLLSICNSVVVNSSPHHDLMNSNGVIENSEERKIVSQAYTNISELQNGILPGLSLVPLRPTNSESFSCENVPTTSRPITETPLSTSVIKLPSKVPRPKLLNIPSMSNLGLIMKKHAINDQTRTHNTNVTTSPNDDNRPIYNINSESSSPIYESESPDELALVYAAKAYNIKLIKRTPSSAIISLPAKTMLAFEILHVLPFDSNRKCMSIVVRHPNTNEIVLYTKGADSTILQCLNAVDEASIVTATSIVKIRQHLYNYARQGLRTLVMAKKSLTQHEYDTWRAKHAEAESSNDNREKKIRESYSSLESHLTLLGATGIEDKLQEGVPEAIAALVDAGIVVWVLTGDKPETAVNIAYSSKLFTPTMQLLKLQARSKTVTENLIHSFLEAIRMDNVSVGARQRALVVDGKTLTLILDPLSELTKPFLELTQNCASVLACRATPLQKALIVKVVKETLNIRTLAIGDGANDVSMIQTADVGVGISGREGTQAVMASDFAIAKFEMLARLLLLHGHWCYDRLARMILYFFYKNAMYVFVIFWYQLYCGFSGAVMIDQMYLMFYNLLFTSLPPLTIGIYDKIAPADILLMYPELYSRGRLGLAYKPHSFWITMADALYQSIAIFFITEAAYHDSDVDIWEFGTTITTSCIFVVLIHVGLEVKSWTIIHVGSLLVSIGIFFGFCFIYNTVWLSFIGIPGSFWVMPVVVTRSCYWLTVLLTSVVASLPRFVYKAVKNTLAPDIILRARMQNQMKHETATITTTTMTPQSQHRVEDNLIAGWSRSSQHATIRSGGAKNSLTTIVA